MELEIDQIYKFTNQGENLLIASSDNKAKVFDTYSQQIQSFVLENLTLNTLLTCADIYQDKQGKNILCVFGNSKGQVILYNVNKSEKIYTLNLHNKAVIDISFSENSDYIYTISSDKQLKKVDTKLQQEVFTKEVKKRGFIEKAKIEVYGKNQVLYSVDNKITLLNTETNVEIQKFTGHSQYIQMLRVSQDNSYFISFSNEGFVNIFNEKQSTPVYTVNILSQSKIINLEISAVTKKQYLVLIHQTDSLTINEVTFDNNPTVKPQEHSSIIRLPKPILYSSMNKNNLQIIYGSTVDIKFKTMQMFQQIPQQKNNKKQQQKAKLNNEGIQEQLEQILKSSVKVQKTINPNNEQKEQNSSTYVVGENDFNQESNKGEIQQEDLEEQLEKVGILENLKKYQQDQNDGENSISTVKSLAVVLLQGLHNNDQQLLDFCLEKDDDILIENTIKKLLPSKVGILIENITDRINRFPYKASVQCKWLKYIIKYHNSILISTPQIHQKLGPLLSMIEGRTKNLNKLIALRGKIDMVLSLRRAQQSKQAEEAEEIKPLVIYNEGEEELIEGRYNLGMQDALDKEIDDSVSDSGEQIEEDSNEEDDIDEDFLQAQKAARQQGKDDLYGDEEEEDDMEDQDSNYMEF